ncbi:DUF6959 family protein [Nocardia sp. NBC_00881]|uniref:DUF6959 family protein n=1 Tax=Nocardia sp. NBC_00881 TaxID=2975995 RepID=UPI0038647ADB
MDIELQELANRGNIRLVRDSNRKFPGLLVQGDTLKSLLETVEEDCPGSLAHETLVEWVDLYESMMREAGIDLPYYRP